MNYWIIPSLVVTTVIGIYFNQKRLIPYLVSDDILIHFKTDSNHRKRIFSSKKIAITIDDVPYGDSTEGILRVLNEYESMATFFVISDLVDSYKKTVLLTKIINDGHELANHGKTDSIHALKNELDLYVEIDECDKKLDELYKYSNKERPKTKFYRPGSGWISSSMRGMRDIFNYTITLGNLIMDDPHIPLSLLHYYHIINSISTNDILIIHDRPWTVPLLEKLLPWLKANDYECITLNEAIAERSFKEAYTEYQASEVELDDQRLTKQ